jgi:hypothetical protein
MGKEKIIMNIWGVLVNIQVLAHTLCEIAPDTYKDCVVKEGTQEGMNVEVLRALHTMLAASQLHHKASKQH